MVLCSGVRTKKVVFRCCEKEVQKVRPIPNKNIVFARTPQAVGPI